ncbi:MAG: DUF1501 domain-containing protein [Candidatus Competibacterales bacterium]
MAKRRPNSSSKLPLTRRRLLGTASCASLGSTTLLSNLFNLQLMSAAAADSGAMTSVPAGDYKAMVCLLLAGGNDSYNMVVPLESVEYDAYSATRTDLALARESLLPIVDGATAKTYGLHPSMPEMQALYDQGKVAMVANVGTLVEPVTGDQVRNGSAPVPLGLYSHIDQIDQWQTSVPDRRSLDGFAGRMADLLASYNSQSGLSLNVSLSGNNIFQTGASGVGYSVDPIGGAVGIFGLDDDDLYAQLKKANIQNTLEQRYHNLFEQQFVQTVKGSMATQQQFSSALAGTPTLTTAFSPDELSASMATIAKIIAVRGALGMGRQTFYVVFGGWDHHDEVLNNQRAMLAVVSKALGDFHSATVELGVEDQVVTFTTSDFARTLTSNGQGSDHAWGSVQLVMGGGVKGGRFYGQYPNLALGSDLDTGRGRLVPTLAVDQYFAELALWFGVAPHRLGDALPNITRFYDPLGGQPPLGMLA